MLERPKRCGAKALYSSLRILRAYAYFQSFRVELANDVISRVSVLYR